MKHRWAARLLFACLAAMLAGCAPETVGSGEASPSIKASEDAAPSETAAPDPYDY